MELSIALFVVLVVFSAFFSAVEIAYFSLSPGRVRSMVRRNRLYARLVEKLKSNPHRLLITILIGNNIVNISAASIATKIALDMFGSYGVGIASGAVTLIVLVFGEIVPKSLGQVHAGILSRLSAPFVAVIQFVLLPLVVLFEWLTHLIHWLIPSKKKSLVSEEEIESMLHIGVEEGSVEHHEKQFVERLFRFNDVSVTHAMTPLEDVTMLDGDVPIKSLAHFAAHSGYSRFPVFEGSRENIIGFVHLKDILRASNSEVREKGIKEIVSPASYLTTEAQLDDAFRVMQRERQHMYVVRDAEENVLGVVTMEDVLEELLGEIHDESDSRKKVTT